MDNNSSTDSMLPAFLFTNNLIDVNTMVHKAAERNLEKYLGDR